MSEQVYEIAALILRYFYAILAIVIVIGGVRCALRDGRRARRLRREAPGAGIIGELLVIRGGGEVKRGERYPLGRDMLIGRARKCDLRLTDPSIYPQHGRLELREGGVLIAAVGHAPLCMRGQALDSEIFVCDGEMFSLGDITFQLTVYDIGVELLDEAEFFDPPAIGVHSVSRTGSTCKAPASEAEYEPTPAERARIALKYNLDPPYAEVEARRTANTTVRTKSAGTARAGKTGFDDSHCPDAALNPAPRTAQSRPQSTGTERVSIRLPQSPQSVRQSEQSPHARSLHVEEVVPGPGRPGQTYTGSNSRSAARGAPRASSAAPNSTSGGSSAAVRVRKEAAAQSVQRPRQG